MRDRSERRSMRGALARRPAPSVRRHRLPTSVPADFTEPPSPDEFSLGCSKGEFGLAHAAREIRARLGQDPLVEDRARHAEGLRRFLGLRARRPGMLPGSSSRGSRCPRLARLYAVLTDRLLRDPQTDPQSPYLSSCTDESEADNPLAMGFTDRSGA